jgi:uncharacterized protein (DUF934 family)
MAREQVKRAASVKDAPARPAPPGVLLRDGVRVVGDPWVFVADDQPAPPGADIVVSVTRLQKEGEALARRKGRLGVIISPSEAVEEMAAYIPQLALICVDFPAYRDGRGFTTARLLRQRYRYQGPLRATGDVLQDLVFFMLRVGIDEFVLKAKDPEAAFARAARTFSQVYQPSTDGRPIVKRLRRRAQR